MSRPRLLSGGEQRKIKRDRPCVAVSLAMRELSSASM
jgi:hypothetical protein